MRAWSSSFSLFLLGAAGLAATSCGQAQGVATISVSWSLIRASDPDPLNAPSQPCENVGVSTIRIDTGGSGFFDFDCNRYAAQTATFPAGYYTIQASAFGKGGKLYTVVDYKNVYAFGETRIGPIRFSIP
jgi:hypothetical protein